MFVSQLQETGSGTKSNREKQSFGALGANSLLTIFRKHVTRHPKHPSDFFSHYSEIAGRQPMFVHCERRTKNRTYRRDVICRTVHYLGTVCDDSNVTMPVIV